MVVSVILDNRDNNFVEPWTRPKVESERAAMMCDVRCEGPPCADRPVGSEAPVVMDGG